MTKATKEELVLYKRHGELVDAKFMRGLSIEEAQELEEVRSKLDEIEYPFYDAAYRRICAMLGLDPGEGL